MSLTGALRSALSGLSVAQVSLDVTAGNITNANTPGYTRKVAELKTQVIGSQNAGGGVTVAGIKRNISESLQLEARNQTTKLGGDKARFEFIERTQSIFGSPGANSSLTARLTEFTNQLESIAVNPNDPVRHTELLSMAQSLTNQIRSNANDLQTLRADVDKELGTSANAVNTAIDDIGLLNEKISRNMTMGLPVGDLEDQRDVAINKIAEQLSIRTFKRDNGEVVVYTSNGYKLIDSSPQYLDYTGAAFVQPDTLKEEGGFNPIALTNTSLPTDLSVNLRDGRMQALLELRDKLLPDMASQLENVARMLQDAVNAAHNRTVAFPPPQALTGTRPVEATDPFHATGTLRIAVTNARGEFVDYADINMATATAGGTVGSFMAAVNATTTAVGAVALNTLGTLSLVNGRLVASATTPGNGIALGNADAPAVPATEGVTGHNKGISHFFGLNDFFASQPLQSNPNRLVSVGQHRLTDALTGTGLARFNVTDANGTVQATTTVDLATIGTVGDLVNAINTAAIGMTASIGTDGKLRLVADNSDRSVETELLNPPATASNGQNLTSYFRLTDPRHVATSLAVRTELVQNPQRLGRGLLNGATLTPPLTPPVSAITAGDARGVQAIADAFGKNQNFPATRTLNSLTTTIPAYATLFLSASARTVRELDDTYQAQVGLQKELDARMSAVSGVDVEQEMANLVMLESAYNAAAQVVRVTKDMFDKLESVF